MHRILLHFGNFKIYSYGVMQALAYIIGIYVAVYYGKKRKIESDKVIDLSLWIVFGAIIGARLWFILEDWHYFSGNIAEVFKVWNGGLVFYGGFIGAVVAMFIYIKKYNLDSISIMDMLSPSLAIGISVGRIGCFLNGCCYGKISYHGGISFPAKDFPPPYIDQLQKGLIKPGATHSLPVIPTQLYSSLDGLIIFLILVFIASRIKIKGVLVSSLFILYGIHRFVIDFFRAYSGNALALKIMTLSQFVSLCIIIAGIVGLSISLRKGVKYDF